MRSLRLAILLLLASPAGNGVGARLKPGTDARPSDATIVSQDLPIGVTRTTAGAVAPVRFDLVAFHWQGSGRVLFRTRSQAGRWSPWRRGAPGGEGRPERASRETRAPPGWGAGN